MGEVVRFGMIVLVATLLALGMAPTVVHADDLATDAPWVVRSREIELDLRAFREAARDAALRPRLTLELFDGVALPIAVRDAAFGTPDDFVVRGDVVRALGSAVHLAVRGDSAYGVITLPNVGIFELRPRGGGMHTVSQIDPTLLPTCGVDDALAVDAGDDAHGVAPPPVAGAGTGETIDVLVVYTPAARAHLGDEAGMLALIDVAMQQTNDALANSGVTATMRLVGTAELEYQESGSPSTDLSRLRRVADGFMDGVHDLRRELGADLVKLLVRYQGGGVACGVAYLMQSTSGGFAGWAFGVTRVECIGGFTFPHELGHTMGSQHDFANGQGGAPVFPYSYGHRFFGNSGSQWRTVMAYAPGTRILHFSNPAILFDGQPTGVPAGAADQADNALSIENAAPVVAGFRTAPCETAPNTLRVPSDFPTIQAAIDAANACDEILVAPGVYSEILQIDARTVILRSEAGPEATVLSGAGLNARILDITRSSGIVIDGFTIANAGGAAHRGIAIRTGSEVELRNVHFKNNISLYPLLIGDANEARLVDCRFEGNFRCIEIGEHGIAHLERCDFVGNFGVEANILNHGGLLTVTDSEFVGNTVGQGAGAIENRSTNVPTATIVESSSFRFNTSTAPGGALRNTPVSAPALLRITNSWFCGNAPDDITGPWVDGGGNLFQAACPPPDAPPAPIVTRQACGTATLAWPNGASPPPGVVWHWQVGGCGVSTTLGADPTLVVTASGQYALRALQTGDLAWSLGCGSIEVTVEGEAVLGDLNGDCAVDGADLGMLLANWGPCPDCATCVGDLDGDCTVDGADLGMLLANWTGASHDEPAR